MKEVSLMTSFQRNYKVFFLSNLLVNIVAPPERKPKGELKVKELQLTQIETLRNL